MHSQRTNVAIAITYLCLLCAWQSASAQQQRSGDNSARLMQQLQSLTAERLELKSENDKLKAELEAAQKQLTSTQSERTSLERRLKAAEAGAAVAEQDGAALEKTRAQLQELIGRFRETATTLRDVETDRNTTRDQLKQRGHELDQCAIRNAGLYDLNSEILDRLENRSVWSALSEKEPFTRIQRARLENLIDADRERAAELRAAENADRSTAKR